MLNIYEEYQWFIDNNFPIALPKFYAKIYQKNKKLFARKTKTELNKIYNKKDYQLKNKIVKNNWKKIEKIFFDILGAHISKFRNQYTCYVSLYGPEGQFRYPGIISLRVKSDKDIKNANETIAHELVHLLIYRKAKKLKLNYEQTESAVDLFFAKTKLKTVFPHYKSQHISVRNKKDLWRAIF